MPSSLSTNDQQKENDRSTSDEPPTSDEQDDTQADSDNGDSGERADNDSAEQAKSAAAADESKVELLDSERARFANLLDLNQPSLIIINPNVYRKSSDNVDFVPTRFAIRRVMRRKETNHAFADSE